VNSPDSLPRIYSSPRKFDTRFRKDVTQFGPFTTAVGIERVLENLEEKFRLRKLAFQIKFGENKTELRRQYLDTFEEAVKELPGIIEERGGGGGGGGGEEGEGGEGLLFDSETNFDRDVVAVCSADDDEEEGALLVQVLQLRKGVLRGKFNYEMVGGEGTNQGEKGEGEENRENRFGEAIFEALTRHFSSFEQQAGGSIASAFPSEILIMEGLGSKEREREIRDLVKRESGGAVAKCVVRKTRARGPAAKTDKKVMALAVKNVQETARVRGLEGEGERERSWKKKQAEDLQTILQMRKVPRVVECFDVSHTSGLDAVCSRVVFVDGKPRKDLYRIFKVKGFEGNDDYRSIREVIARRMKRGVAGEGGEVGGKGEQKEGTSVEKGWELPDLVCIDGGVGQLGAAVKGMRDAGVDFMAGGRGEGEGERGVGVSIPICSLAKKKEEVFTYIEGEGGEGEARLVNSQADEPGVLLLRALRDESHRFALAKHRARRRKMFLAQ